MECISLRMIAIPSTAGVINGITFCSCKQLEEVEIRDGVGDIMDHAFRGCKSTRRLRTAPSVRAIGYEVFFDCDALEEAELAEGLE